MHIPGDEFHDFKNFAIIYSVLFRLMSTNLNITFLSPSPSKIEETVSVFPTEYPGNVEGCKELHFFCISFILRGICDPEVQSFLS